MSSILSTVFCLLTSLFILGLGMAGVAFALIILSDGDPFDSTIISRLPAIGLLVLSLMMLLLLAWAPAHAIENRLMRGGDGGNDER